MLLKSIRIENFRCYEDLVVEFDRITTLVGRNDAGKSSILEALNVFFDNSKLDKEDVCNLAGGKNVAITCEFCDFSDLLVIDEDVETSLSEECLLSEEGTLIIKKVVKTGSSKSDISIIAKYPINDEYKDVFSMNIASLRTRAKDVGADIGGINKTVKSYLRRAIREKLDLIFEKDVEVVLSGADGNKIYDKISSNFPTFHLFKADRQSSDSDPEAQNPLKAAVKAAVKDLEDRLNDISAEIECKLKSIAGDTAEKLKKLAPEYGEELIPVFAKQEWSKVFSISLNDESNIPINKRGSGYRRLMLMAFFQAEAERVAVEKNRKNIILAVEEPETALHPSMQVHLIDIFQELVETGQYQMMLTTHSPALARLLPTNSIRFISAMDLSSPRIVYSGEDALEMTAKALGLLRNHGVKVFICVEGRNDIEFLKNYSSAVSSFFPDYIDNLSYLESSGEVVFIPMGGSTLDLWAARRLSLVNVPEVYIFDSDKDGYNSVPKLSQQEAHDVVVNRIACGESCSIVMLDSRELENYVHPEVVKLEYSEYEISSLRYDMFTDVPRLIAKLVHERDSSATPWELLTPEKVKQKESKVKKRLARAVKRTEKWHHEEMVSRDGSLDDFFRYVRAALGS